MADCTFARCQQERRAIRRELQRWTKNMVYVLGLERVAEELMGRRKWKLYQDALLPRYRSESRGEGSSEEEAEPPMPAAEPPAAPALKIKTIEQINTTQEEENTNTPEYGTKPPEPSPQPKETILESLIKRPATQPRVPTEDTFDQWKPTGKLCPSHRATDEPLDWKPADKCYFCVEEPAGNVGAAEQEAGGGGAPGRSEGGANSPAASDSGSSSVSGGARSPGAPPALLAHLLQLQNHNPQAIAQLQQMMAALAALGTGLMPPAALSQAWLLQRLQQNQMLQQQQHVDRLTADMGEKVSVSNSSPLPFAGAACVQAGSATEQPLDLSARSGSSTGEPATPPPDTKLTSRVPPIDPKFLANVRLKRPATDGLGSMGNARRAYTEDELQNALRDIKSGRLGTRRAAVLYGIPRSTLRNKVYKLALDQPTDADGDRDSADEDDAEAYRSLLLQAPDAQQRDDDDAAGVILKIPTFPPPDRDDSPPPTQVPLYDPPHMPGLPPGPHERLFSLRDVIAKSINQKFHQPPPDIRPDGQQDLAFGRPPDRHISVIKHLPDGQRSFSHVNNAGHSRANNNGATPAPGGKGTRPKRGKYRNYDRDSLVEAVKAVQRGEMSVHRAGSYYGVPHSTLEYKVKERHLMRPRKREPKQPLTTDNKPQVPPKPTVQKPQVKPGFSNGMNGPDSLAGGYPPPGYPFWSHPASFPPMASGSFTPGSELFASHMMQRLREESTPQVPTANGSFLEGIIRSTLDRPALLQRLAGEPPPQQNSIGPQRLNDMNASNLKANANLLQRLNSDSSPNLPQSATLLQRLTCETADEGSPPPARRPRLSSSDRQLAAEMRETVQRLRADKLRAAGRNGTPTPPVAVPATTTAPSDRA